MKKFSLFRRGDESTLPFRLWEFTGSALLMLFVLILLLTYLFPLVYMFTTALKDDLQLQDGNAPLLPAVRVYYEYQDRQLWVFKVPTEAGIKERYFIDWFRDHPHEEDVQILKWVDENGDPDAYVDWYSFDHPQLGPVELGGYNSVF